MAMSGAEKARRARERERAGIFVFPVPLTCAVLAAMIEEGLISEAEAFDREATGEVIADIVCQFIKIPSNIRNRLRRSGAIPC
jgi:hypothetical protein